jgi:hypothetical protein
LALRNASRTETYHGADLAGWTNFVTTGDIRYACRKCASEKMLQRPLSSEMLAMCHSIKVCNFVLVFVHTGKLPSLLHKDVVEDNVNSIFAYLRKQVWDGTIRTPEL